MNVGAYSQLGFKRLHLGYAVQIHPDGSLPEGVMPDTPTGVTTSTLSNWEMRAGKKHPSEGIKPEYSETTHKDKEKAAINY